MTHAAAALTSALILPMFPKATPLHGFAPEVDPVTVKTTRLHRRVSHLEQAKHRLRRKLHRERTRARRYRRQLHHARALPIVYRLGVTLEREGFRVSENPYFGGVEPVHVATSYHYPPCSCAIDVNWPDPATEPEHLDALDRRLTSAPALRGHIRELLWRAPGHYDHLHIAVT